jgi:hypothetical protein
MIAWRPTSCRGDVLRRVLGGGRDADAGEHALGIVGGPLQNLHSAHRSADDGEQAIDAQRLDEQRLCPNHVGDGDHREGKAVGSAGGRIDRGGAGAAHAAADDIGADDEMTSWIQRQRLADQARPPARAPARRMGSGDMLVQRQGVADEDGVGALVVEFAKGAIGDLEVNDPRPAIQAKGDPRLEEVRREPGFTPRRHGIAFRHGA